MAVIKHRYDRVPCSTLPLSLPGLDSSLEEFQEAHWRCVCSDTVCCMKRPLEYLSTLFCCGRTCTMVIVLNGDGKFSSHVSLKWKTFVFSASPPSPSSQWHLKGENKIAKHKPRERRKSFSWRSIWSALVFSPLLAHALLAESLPAFSQPMSWMCLGCLTESVVWPVPLSHCVSWSYRKAATAFPLPAGSWVLKSQGW